MVGRYCKIWRLKDKGKSEGRGEEIISLEFERESGISSNEKSDDCICELYELKNGFASIMKKIHFRNDVWKKFIILLIVVFFYPLTLFFFSRAKNLSRRPPRSQSK